MKPKLLRLPYLLLASASLCGLILLATAEQPAKAGSGIASAPTDTPMIQAGDATAVTPRRVRRHGSLSMPYFSFAQSLRSGN